ILRLRDRSGFAPQLVEQLQKRSLYFDDTVVNALAEIARDDDQVLQKVRALPRHRDDLVKIRGLEALLASERAEGSREEALQALEKIHYAALKKNDGALRERSARALRRVRAHVAASSSSTTRASRSGSTSGRRSSPRAGARFPRSSSR